MEWRGKSANMRASAHSIANMRKLPLPARLLKEAHAILLSGVCGPRHRQNRAKMERGLHFRKRMAEFPHEKRRYR